MSTATIPTIEDLERARVREALYDISRRTEGGVLHPQAVVDAARDVEHPLHRFFTWDDHEAAEHLRLIQAGALIRRVRVVVVRPPSEGPRMVNVSTTRAFQSRPTMRQPGGGYERIEDILADDGKRNELVAQVVRDLVAYRKRYADLSELRAVWISVDDAAAEFAVDPSASAPDADARPGAAG
jgi:hypothetical protein